MDKVYIIIPNLYDMDDKSLALKNPFDFSENAATTKWVQEHEWSSNMDRWNTVFDCRDEKINWGYSDGIKGGKVLKPTNLRSIYTQGHRVRFFVSLKKMNPICITGEFYDDSRMLCGTTLCDGKSVSSISVDVDLKNETITVYGHDLTKDENISGSCNLVKIQKTW